jgi:hypothetical protein
VYSIWNGCCRLGGELTLPFQRSRSWPTPQSPELGDLVSAYSRCRFLPQIP